jgi:hypothetical protein
MNLKNLAIATAAALSFAAVPMASANNTPDQLAELTPGGCYLGAPNGADKQYAEWSWAGEGEQTQFGGGAVYTVSYTILEQASSDTLEVEVELTRLDPELPMPTKMVYACPDLLTQNVEAEGDNTGSCEARISDVDAAIMEATEGKLVEESLLGDGESLIIHSSELVGVFVKAMNPGVAKGRGGRQNYEKTDVCDVPE